MFTANKVRYLLVAAAVAFSVNAAHAGWDPVGDTGKALGGAAKTIANAVTPPHVDLHVDPKKPLTPVTGKIEKDGVTVTITPGPVPAPPVVHAPGNGVIADVVNKTNEIAQKPKNWIDQKGEEINRGAIHLGNEIGMLWANLKHSIEDKANDFFAWLKELAEKWGLRVLAGIGVLFLLRSFLRFMIGHRPTARHA
jgi:hypothetical protein